ncbi:hydantoinase/oxoprolinase family protein [Pyrobaculum sp. 3827-6]|uniref:hydantoinase/oxoprolinase family protein n=1 Tax=Pyrobaculum sp. 3827-6 TaxID=2983604 RepID=UPI0021D8597D|nr:hydantoinase/oxoprolinase family protein [Pyrobaculum sp. 3827-6]MCU7788685.1 hydantoinase/oxoprolinase family protein [Pyrobaculum sp. 3827-6]
MIVAVDVGGTFTDFVAVDEEGRLLAYKILSTPRKPEQAVVDGLSRLPKVEEVLHASTIGTNALLGQMGLELPKVALFTTKGFRDVIEIGRQNRPRLYDLYFDKPRPIVPRELRFEVDERTLANGTVLKEVDPGEVEQYAKKAVESGVVSVAVSFLHSYINPSNEARAGEVLRRFFRYVSLSSEVAPEPREYERTSTAVVNAALMPLVGRYLEELGRYAESRGGRLYVMSSSGGLVTAGEAARKPVHLIESGPAGGVVAAAEFAKILGLPRVISFDMGGTTAKAGTVVNSEPSITTEYEVGGEAHHGRLVKGSGYPVRFPLIDLAEVSAGGGTIIWRDEGGALRVGPVSAGAEPGPVCYGRGGAEPTITDANVVLGRVAQLLGGEMKLDADAAYKSFRRLGDPVEVAWSAVQLANLEMARAVRLVTVERGLDPSEFALFAFGGAGPQHAAELAEELGVKTVVIPPEPGVFTALGMLFADSKFEARASYPRDLEEAYRRLEESLSPVGPTYYVRLADVRYQGQGWELVVPVGRPASLEEVRRAFEEKHLATYGFKLDRPIEVVTVRVFAVVARKRPRLREPEATGEPKPTHRRVYFGEWVEAPVYKREELPRGFKTEGPAVIEERHSATVVPPKWRVEVGPLGSLVLRQ